MKQNDLLLKPFVSWCSSQGIVSPLEIRVRPVDGYRYVCMAGAATYNQQQQQQKQQSNKEQDNNNNNIINLIQCPLNGKACFMAASMEELADRVEFEASLGEESHFYPYLQVLPQEFPGMPRFWPREQLDFVSQFDDGLLEREHVSTTSTASLSLSATSASSASWARAIVDSRANHLPYGNGDVTVLSSYALTPFLDMINHDGSVLTSAHVEKTSSNEKILHLDIQAPANGGIRVGHEVKTSYGKLTNIEMLLNYGFLEKNGNAWNRESFYVRTLSNPKPILVTCLDKDGSVDRMSLGAVRKSLATTDELTVAEHLLGRRTSSSTSSSSQTSSSPSMTMVPFLSKRNEEETYALIAGFMDAAVYMATKGAQEALQIKESLETSSTSSSSSSSRRILQYGIIADYLMGRASTLQNSLDRVNVLLEHPQVFHAQEQALLVQQQRQQQ